jgi:hypothetical protein
LGAYTAAAARHDLLEILEERYGRRSTIITSQIPIDEWYELIAIPPTLTPFSIASFTTRTGSTLPAMACDAHAPQKRISGPPQSSLHSP